MRNKNRYVIEIEKVLSKVITRHGNAYLTMVK